MIQRRLPVGAELCGKEGVHFRVWAPRRKRVDVVLDGSRSHPLAVESHGYFSGLVESARAGSLYQFCLDATDRLYPDPASRYQPEGPHGPSQVIDPSAFRWTDDLWRGIRIEGQVMYEMHIGTFTIEGTWSAAQTHLDELADLGITALEIMPVAAFPGAFGWGYDGVDLFAPAQQYGTPDDFRRFVDRAHSLGLGVILDVVYNHLGPDGNYLREFASTYFTTRYENEWGDPINFDGPGSEGTRELFISNARYWIEEFHLDGLRMDATQQIFDSSSRNIMSEVSAEARRAAQPRDIIIVAENEPQRAELTRDTADALWNDDFHHSAIVAMTGRTEAYYSDYLGTPQEFISAAMWGFLYQGQRYSWQKKRRGTPAFDLKPASFVIYIQNHDQIANSAGGKRIGQLTSPALLRALTGLMFLMPNTPFLFQGQEFGASSPFLYFADHNPDLIALVQNGRLDFLRQFPSIAQSGSVVPEVGDRQTFEASRLNHSERATNSGILSLHRDLIRLRTSDPVFKAQRSDWLRGAVVGESAFVLRFLGGEHGDRLLVVNLGRDLTLVPAPHPLLAEPANAGWRVIWSSEAPSYGGCGREPMDKEGTWSLTAQSTMVLTTEGVNILEESQFKEESK
jgi:maltooligosyltrehalose trehalohydrolase